MPDCRTLLELKGLGGVAVRSINALRVSAWLCSRAPAKVLRLGVVLAWWERENGLVWNWELGWTKGREGGRTLDLAATTFMAWKEVWWNIRWEMDPNWAISGVVDVVGKRELGGIRAIEESAGSASCGPHGWSDCLSEHDCNWPKIKWGWGVRREWRLIFWWSFHDSLSFLIDLVV